MSVSLVDTTDESVTYQVGILTVDAEGKVLGSLAAPGGVPDGRYKLVLTGSRYGESAASLTLIKVSGGLFSFANGASDGNMAASKNDDPGVPFPFDAGVSDFGSNYKAMMCKIYKA